MDSFVNELCTSMPTVAAITLVDDIALRVAPVELDAHLEAIYSRHFRDIYRYVLGFTRSHEEAEDVTAETFERALSAWNSPGHVPVAPLPWLLLTARRVAVDRWRRARRFLSLPPSVRSIDVGADRRRSEFWIWFDALAGVLTGRQREVLLLHVNEGLTYKQIAERQGLTYRVILRDLTRAYSQLRMQLKQDDLGDMENR